MTRVFGKGEAKPLIRELVSNRVDAVLVASVEGRRKDLGMEGAREVGAVC